MARALSIHELRHRVKANDKFAAAGKPEADAVELIAKNYDTTRDSALAFVQWLKGAPSGREPDSAKPAGQVLESWHRQGDLEKGVEKLLTDDESAKARKPKSGKKR